MTWSPGFHADGDTLKAVTSASGMGRMFQFMTGP